MLAENIGLSLMDMHQPMPPGLASGMIVLQQDGQPERHPEGWLIRTPLSPYFYFGNLLNIRNPDKYTPEQWQNIFRQAFSDQPEIRHTTLWWQHRGEVPANLTDWVRAGFTLTQMAVMSLRPGHLNSPGVPDKHIKIRRFEDEHDWSEWLRLCLSNIPQGHIKKDYRFQVLDQKARYLKLTDAGAGSHWGVFALDGELMAFAGLYVASQAGRFQYVFTAPEHRRKGYASALIQEIALTAFSAAEMLVLIADENDPAIRLYKKLGFQVISREAVLCRISDQDI